jgi:hypothetical protein
MRTTLTIDDDVLAAVKEIAAKEHKTAGAVISGLARQGIRRHSSQRTGRNGIPLLPTRRGQTRITLQLVKHLQDSLP